MQASMTIVIETLPCAVCCDCGCWLGEGDVIGIT